jgi:hypothetical protein
MAHTPQPGSGVVDDMQESVALAFDVKCEAVAVELSPNKLDRHLGLLCGGGLAGLASGLAGRTVLLSPASRSSLPGRAL